MPSPFHRCSGVAKPDRTAKEKFEILTIASKRRDQHCSTAKGRGATLTPSLDSETDHNTLASNRILPCNGIQQTDANGYERLQMQDQPDPRKVDRNVCQGD